MYSVTYLNKQLSKYPTAMNPSTPEAHEFLRLFKCVVDTGTDVLAAFAKHKLLPIYNGNFEKFLDDKKHEIFHLWQIQKLLCCGCPSAGCTFKRKRLIDNWIFKKFYDDTGPEDKGHIVRNSSGIVEVCLHKYVSRNIAIDELDISTISFLLRNLVILSQNETNSLNIITTTRSQMCHPSSTNCYSMASLNTAWTELENALVDLADPSYKRIIRKQIKFLRKVDLEKEEIIELKNNVEELKIVLHQVFDTQKGDNATIKNGMTTCEHQISKAKQEIIKNTDKKFAEMTEEIQQLKATISIFIEQIPRRNESPNQHNYEHIESFKYSMSERNSEEVYAQQGAKPKTKHEDIKYATCHVECKELDEKLAVQLLPENKHSFPAGFNTITAEQECLLLKLKAPSKMLEDIETFRMALRALLIQIAHAGNIDFNKPNTITMKLIFTDDLTEDETKVIKEISGKLFHSERIVASVNYPAVAVPYDTRGVNIDENCRSCENLQTEVIIQRKTIGMLEFKNRELIFSIIELELLDEWKDRKRSKLALENRHLREKIHEAAASNRKIDRQQEKQDSAGEFKGLLENVQEKRKLIDSSSQTSPLFCMNCLSAYLSLLTRCATAVTLLTQDFPLLKEAISDDQCAMQQALGECAMRQALGQCGMQQALGQCAMQEASGDGEAKKSTGPDKDPDSFWTDIIILHSDKDTIEAHACQKLLMDHINVPHLKVDLSTPESPLLSTMFNTCRLMFIFQTKNFKSDPTKSFKNLMYQLFEDTQKTQRMIPLNVEGGKTTSYLASLPHLRYVKDINDRQFPIFKRRVEQLVEYWRRVLPGQSQSNKIQ